MTNKNVIGSLFVLISGLYGCSESSGPVDGTVDTSATDGNAFTGGQSGTSGSCFACDGEEAIANLDEPLFASAPSANEIYAAVEGTWVLSSYAVSDFCDRPVMTITIQRGSGGKRWRDCLNKIELELNVVVTEPESGLTTERGTLTGTVGTVLRTGAPVTDTPSPQVSVDLRGIETPFAQFTIDVPGTVVDDGSNVDANVVIDLSVSRNLQGSMLGASLESDSVTPNGYYARFYPHDEVSCDDGNQSL
jgi:hypothetical protein